jgi:hypothetical protein
MEYFLLYFAVFIAGVVFGGVIVAWIATKGDDK